MCLAVYLCSDLPVVEIAWDKKKPAFYLQGAAASDPARRKFDGSYVYYAGSHQGCGCGFLKDGEQGEELALSQANYNALAAVLRSALREGAKLQLFTCWEGDQADEPESVQAVSVAALVGQSYELQQLELLTVTSEA